MFLESMHLFIFQEERFGETRGLKTQNRMQPHESVVNINIENIRPT